ncbi:glutathione synthase [Candidatus Cyanaurora vandensis]|uniref:glutathione synthase n=1 Tax=Candidatus Cyanaurora vandensis TaxID=2714958 RepID=UPI00257F1BF9|nr:glutathione synthase [Candidatus Cyanaurora vandensis]
MEFLFVIDPIERLIPNHDTSLALMEAAQGQGYRVWCCTVADLFVAQGGCGCWACPVRLQSEPPFYELGAQQRLRLEQMAVVFMRKDPPVDRAYLFATYLLDRVDPRQTLVVNSPEGLRRANEKMYALNFARYLPEVIVTSQAKEVFTFLEQHPQAVLKPLDGKGGEGIFLLSAQDKNLKALIEVSTQFETIPVMVQRYLPEARLGDKRIIVLAGEPLGGVLRVPQADDVRGNLRVGGRAVATEVTDYERELCAALAPQLVADGLYFVGLDVIGTYLTEVNVTSPTGIQEIDTLNGTHLAQTVITWAAAQRLG